MFMTPEEQLRDRLRKIAVLFAGAATAGERVAAGAAAGRIRERLEQVSRIERDIEVRFSIYLQFMVAAVVRGTVPTLRPAAVSI